MLAFWSSTTILPNAAISRKSSEARTFRRKSSRGGEAALDAAGESEAPPISAMILDLVMPDLDGMAVLERLGATFVQASGHRAGCRRAASTPVRLGHARGRLRFPGEARHAGAREGVACERAEAFSARTARSSACGTASRACSESATSSSALRRWSACASWPSAPPVPRIPVLIEGERGVGKELLAHVHPRIERAARRGRSSTVRCSDLDESRSSSSALRRSSASAGGKLREARAARSSSTRSALFARSVQATLSAFSDDGESEARGACASRRCRA